MLCPAIGDNPVPSAVERDSYFHPRVKKEATNHIVRSLSGCVISTKYFDTETQRGWSSKLTSGKLGTFCFKISLRLGNIEIV